MALIHWKEPRVWSVCWPSDFDDVKSGKHFPESQTILPGIQQIEDEVWEKMKAKVPDVRDRLASGQLAEVKGDKAGEGKSNSNEIGLPKNLTKFSPADAIELIGGVMDVDTLKTWNKIEKRVPVKDAIKAQLKALSSSDDKKGE